MSNGPDKARRRQLKGDYKNAERAVWLASFPVDEERHAALLDQLDVALAEDGCDHTFRHTERWLAAQDLDVEEAIDRYRLMGAGCDCEVLANLDPETRA